MVIKHIALLILGIVSASVPPDTNDMIGNIESAFFDDSGGVFCSDKHGVTVMIPDGAIQSGVKAELKFGATLLAPVKFTKDVLPVSAIIWLCMGVKLQKPVQIQIPHYVNIKCKTQANNLRFAKVMHSKCDESMMKLMDGGKFAVGGSCGSIEVDHFCYFCIVNNYYNASTDYKYQAVVFQNRQLHKDVFNFDICIMAALPTCIQVSVLLCFLCYSNKIKNLNKVIATYQLLALITLPSVYCQNWGIGCKALVTESNALCS